MKKFRWRRLAVLVAGVGLAGALAIPGTATAQPAAPGDQGARSAAVASVDASDRASGSASDSTAALEETRAHVGPVRPNGCTEPGGCCELVPGGPDEPAPDGDGECGEPPSTIDCSLSTWKPDADFGYVTGAGAIDCHGRAPQSFSLLVDLYRQENLPSGPAWILMDRATGTFYNTSYKRLDVADPCQSGLWRVLVQATVNKPPVENLGTKRSVDVTIQQSDC